MIAALSGPISRGDQAANVQAFKDAQAALLSETAWYPCGRERVWEDVFSPVDAPGCQEAAAESAALIERGKDYTRGPLYRAALRLCFARVISVDTVFALPGWRLSAGARAEVWLATAAGIPVLGYHVDHAVRAPILDALLPPALQWA